MKLHYLVLLLAVAGCSRNQGPQRPPARNPILPASGAGTLTLTNNGSGAASLSGDPNAGYLLNIPYFAGFLTTSNSGGTSTVQNGVLNIPQYQSLLTLNTSGTGSASLTGGILNVPNNQVILTTNGTTGASTFNSSTNTLNIPTYSSGTSGGVPSGSFPGQLLVVGTGNTLAAADPGLAEAASSPIVGTGNVTPNCGTTSSIGDLGQTFVLQAGAVVNVPSGTCANAVFYFFSQGASTFNAAAGQTLAIYNGTNFTTATVYAATIGQYITLVRSKAANTWLMAIGNANAGASQFISSITNVGSTGPATVVSGVLNVPDYSTAPEPPAGIQVPSGAFPGQVLAIDSTGVGVIAGSPGLSDSAVSPLGVAYTPNCGTVDLGDRSHVTVVTAAVTITIPSSTNANCKNAVFYFLMRASAILQSSTGDTFDIYNGATARVAQTSYTSATGQYVTAVNGNGSNWHLMVSFAGTAAGGGLNLQEHYFSPDFPMNVATAVASTGQGITNQITAATTPQMQLNYYFIIDSPTVNTKIQAHLYRTTGAIPALGAAPGTGDVQVMIVTFPYAAANALTTLGGSIFDNTGAVTGTPYRYYLALDSAAAQTINIHSQSYIQVAEAP